MKKITILIFTSFLIGLVSCNQMDKKSKSLNIIPKPVKVVQEKGFFTITGKTRIAKPMHGKDGSTAAYLQSVFKSAGVPVPELCEPFEEKNVIRFEYAADEELGWEGYTLEVTRSKIEIKANEPEGLFYGVQTLLQLLPPEVFESQKTERKEWKVPCCKIWDRPRFEWRGMHLDVSRHFFPVEFIKRYIDLIAMHKMNVFHWHLTDDNGWRIEIKKYPLLTEIAGWHVDRENMPWRKVTPPGPGEKATYGGFYSQEEVREIIKYAEERYINIIPEIEMPGHTSEVFAAYPELSCTGKKLYVQPGSYWPNADILCAGKEETFGFIEDVLEEVIALFPSLYIHIGGDEADKTRWLECTLCQQRIRKEKLKDENELQSYFIRRVENFLNSKGKKLIGWDEILEGGLAPDATVMSWRGFKGGIEAAEQGHKVIMCPTSHCYFDYYQANPDFEPEAIGGFTSLKKVYSFEPVPEGLSEENAKFILGAQGNVWTEYIKTPSHAEYMSVPRMTALAEVVWSPADQRDWTDFRKRLNIHFKRFDALKVNYSKGSWKVDIQPVLENGIYKVTLTSEQPDIPIHYTADGTDPSANSPVYKKPLAFSNSVVIKAGLFESGNLMEAFTVKEIVFHNAIGKTGTLKDPPSKNYFASGAASLTDGLKGSENFKDGYWIGFEGTDMDLEIDLNEDLPISSVEASFYQQAGSWIFMPEKVVFQIFDNNHILVAESEIKTTTPLGKNDAIIEKFSAGFENLKARYIRVIAVNIKTCPEWHVGKGSKAWVFADEVIVNGKH
jgi:hexosaminidase